MIFLPALRLATLPLPPAFFAARFFAAAIRPPLVFFTLASPDVKCSIHARIFKDSHGKRRQRIK
jgi:hypothetical protein